MGQQTTVLNAVSTLPLCADAPPSPKPIIWTYHGPEKSNHFLLCHLQNHTLTLHILCVMWGRGEAEVDSLLPFWSFPSNNALPSTSLHEGPPQMHDLKLLLGTLRSPIQFSKLS